jgi:hypothetical protein
MRLAFAMLAKSLTAERGQGSRVAFVMGCAIERITLAALSQFRQASNGIVKEE